MKKLTSSFNKIQVGEISGKTMYTIVYSYTYITISIHFFQECPKELNSLKAPNLLAPLLPKNTKMHRFNCLFRRIPLVNSLRITQSLAKVQGFVHKNFPDKMCSLGCFRESLRNMSVDKLNQKFSPTGSALRKIKETTDQPALVKKLR